MGSSKYPRLGFDPAPGDPKTVRLTTSLIGRADRESGVAQLSEIGASGGIRVGRSADTFTKSTDKIQPHLK
ncbi:hypothetical protein [Streptomyces incanus]|uniref:Uncharacterized protein n=1 Tax=Streptomyces incanus TaxID=887453 RepID=A0ABW0XJG1_9ACTN